MPKPGAVSETIRVQPPTLAQFPARFPLPSQSTQFAHVDPDSDGDQNGSYSSSSNESPGSVDVAMFNSLSNKSKIRPSGRPRARQPSPPPVAPKPRKRQAPTATESSSEYDDESDDSGSEVSNSNTFKFTPPEAVKPQESRMAKEVRIEAILGALKLEVPDLHKLSNEELDQLDEKLKAQSAREQGLNLMRRGMIIFVAIVEHVHAYFNPDHKYLLEGWSMEVFNDLHAYDKHLLQVYDYYATAAPLHPLVGFMLALGGSAVMYAMTRTFMRFSIESMRGLTDPTMYATAQTPGDSAAPHPQPRPQEPVVKPPPEPMNARPPPPASLFQTQPTGPTGGHPMAGNPLFGAVSGLMNSGALGPIMDGLVGMMQQGPGQAASHQSVPPRPLTGGTSAPILFPTTSAVAASTERDLPLIEEAVDEPDEKTTRLADLPSLSYGHMSPPNSPRHSDADAGPEQILEQLQAEEDATYKIPITDPKKKENDVFQINLS